ncbi:hypothetical protein D9757_005817 [Collybiopsis confluens]|uniref:DUF6699 domain-containing protein n=1 Tax=Collybiopsis confluens TaxID=2823264 RepID=A0A8H5H6C8_9AGAR|nr:hypothetical protein D9757_008054 [Collybiopsis confluens]KAF5387340.1 hypothetical protein D9757_005817 [Collybiopsis confluens]
MDPSTGHGDTSLRYRNQRVAGARRYTLSDTELSLPSARLQRQEIVTRSLSSSPYGVYFPSRQVIATAAPLYIPSGRYRGSPPPQSAPALHYSVSPYAHIPLPSQSSVANRVSLHPLLRVASESVPQNNGTTELYIDLASPPEAIQITLTAAMVDRFQPATQPPLPSMSITHPLLPWYITVHRTVSAHVTVLDVLDTICRELNKRVPQMSEERDRRRRIDLLQGRRRFRGLREVNSGEDVWELVNS